MINSYILSWHRNVTDIYDFPISSYSIIGGQVVLIYYEKGYFIHPRNYTSKFLSEIENNLNDDWHIKKIDKQGSYSFNGSLLSHPFYWKIIGSKKIEYEYDELDILNIIYGESDFFYTNINPMMDIRYKNSN